MKLVQRIRKIVTTFFDAARVIVFCGGALLIFYLICEMILRPLSPLITICFALLGTFVAFFTRRTAILAILRIVIYGFSWPAANWLGIWPASFICAAGFGAWFLAAGKGFTQLAAAWGE